MNKRVKVAIISGCFSFITAIIGYCAGQYVVQTEVNNHISQVVNVENGDYSNAVDYIVNQNSEFQSQIDNLKEENIALLSEIENFKKTSGTNTSSHDADDKKQSENKAANSNTKENLFNMQPLIGSVSGFTGITYGEAKDNLGNTYPNGYQILCGYGENTITYALDKKYEMISGEIALSDSSNAIRDGIWLEFYGDGELIGTTEHLFAGVRPISFEFDVNGVTDLKIQAKGDVMASMLTNGIYIQ